MFLCDRRKKSNGLRSVNRFYSTTSKSVVSITPILYVIWRTKILLKHEFLFNVGRIVF